MRPSKFTFLSLSFKSFVNVEFPLKPEFNSSGSCLLASFMASMIAHITSNPIAAVNLWEYSAKFARPGLFKNSVTLLK